MTILSSSLDLPYTHPGVTSSDGIDKSDILLVKYMILVWFIILNMNKFICFLHRIIDKGDIYFTNDKFVQP